MKTFRSLLWGLALLPWLTFAHASAAEEPHRDSVPFLDNVLRAKTQDIAKTIKILMAKKGYGSVTIGSFAGPPTKASVIGPAIKLNLIQELETLGVKTAKLGAPLGIQGSFRLNKEKDGDYESTDLVVSIILVDDQSGKTVQDLDAIIPNINREILVNDPKRKDLLDSNPYRQPGEPFVPKPLDELDKNELPVNIGKRPGELDFKKPIFDPVENEVIAGGQYYYNLRVKPEALAGLYIDPQNTVYADKLSPYGVQILVNNRVAEVKNENGFPFISVKLGDEFTVRMINRTGANVANEILIDGMNSFVLADEKIPGTNRSKLSKYLLSPQQTYDVPGWYKNDRENARFTVGKYGEGVATRLGEEKGIGGITIITRATWLKNQQPPADEPPRQLYTKQEFEIVDGKMVPKISQEDKRPRDFGVIRSVITIRYEK